MALFEIDWRLERELAPHLLKEEQLLWVDEGRSSLPALFIHLWFLAYAGNIALLVMLFGLFALLFKDELFVVMIVCFLPFLGLLFLTILGKFGFFKAHKNLRTIYAISKTRVMIKRLLPYSSFMSIRIANVPGLFILHDFNKTGTIILAEEVKKEVNNEHYQPSWSDYSKELQLNRIKEVHEVHKLLYKLKYGEEYAAPITNTEKEDEE